MRAALYARVSSDEQTQGYSLETQIQRMQEYAERNGLVVTHIFVEDFSGMYLERPELTKLLALVDEGEIDAVEDRVGVVADLHAGERRERAVVELHDHTLEGLQRRRDLQQPQLDRTISAEERPARKSEQQAVADLSGGAGDGDLEGGGC